MDQFFADTVDDDIAKALTAVRSDMDATALGLTDLYPEFSLAEFAVELEVAFPEHCRPPVIKRLIRLCRPHPLPKKKKGRRVSEKERVLRLKYECSS